MAQSKSDLFPAYWSYTQMARRRKRKMAQPLERAGKINRMVPGHKKLYKQAGITKLQVKAERAQGYKIIRRKKAEDMVFSKEMMKQTGGLDVENET